MTIRRKRLTILLALAAVALVLTIQGAVSRSRIRGCFDDLRAAINAENYEGAYSLTTADYRAANTLEDFIAYESWRGEILDEGIEISAWLRTVRTDTLSHGSQGFWRMSFDRIDGKWRYRGDRTAYIEKL